MKSTGILRKLDQLGRVVLPIELRRNMNINEKDPIEIFVDGDQIILRKYEVQKSCMITGDVSEENVEYASGVWLSPEGAKILLTELEKSML